MKIVRNYNKKNAAKMWESFNAEKVEFNVMLTVAAKESKLYFGKRTMNRSLYKNGVKQKQSDDALMTVLNNQTIEIQGIIERYDEKFNKIYLKIITYPLSSCDVYEYYAFELNESLQILLNISNSTLTKDTKLKMEIKSEKLSKYLFANVSRKNVSFIKKDFEYVEYMNVTTLNNIEKCENLVVKFSKDIDFSEIKKFDNIVVVYDQAEYSPELIDKILSKYKVEYKLKKLV